MNGTVGRLLFLTIPLIAMLLIVTIPLQMKAGTINNTKAVAHTLRVDKLTCS